MKQLKQLDGNDRLIGLVILVFNVLFPILLQSLTDFNTTLVVSLFFAFLIASLIVVLIYVTRKISATPLNVRIALLEEEIRLLKSKLKQITGEHQKLIEIKKTIQGQLNDLKGKIEHEFEVLHVHTELTLTERDGSTASYKRNQRIKVLVKDLENVIELVQCAGSILKFKDNSGVVREEKAVSGKKFITEFKTPYKNDEVIEREVQFEIIDSFPEQKEYWEIKSYSRSRTNVFTLNFPSERPYKKLRLFRLNGLRPQKMPFDFLTKTEHSITLSLPEMRPFETFRLEWDW